ncbi:hypothetical protein SAMN05444166_0455 [Singulisphaera sp. GP187]|nr:hypothetical protein SAMN05444166_0455 [Singulisphaera sp. GP187]
MGRVPTREITELTPGFPGRERGDWQEIAGHSVTRLMLFTLATKIREAGYSLAIFELR